MGTVGRVGSPDKEDKRQDSEQPTMLGYGGQLKQLLIIISMVNVRIPSADKINSVVILNEVI